MCITMWINPNIKKTHKIKNNSKNMLTKSTKCYNITNNKEGYKMKKEIEIVKENEMQYAIYINGVLYTRTGSMYIANQIKKNLEFIYQ